MGEVLGIVHGMHTGTWFGGLHLLWSVDRYGGAEMVSREKFTRDMMRAQDAKRFAESEAAAQDIITCNNGRRSCEEISVYESYMHNKRYGKGKKCTKFQYQC